MSRKQIKKKRSPHGNRALGLHLGAALVCSTFGFAGEAQEFEEIDDSAPVSSAPMAPPTPSFGMGSSQIAPFGSLFDSGSPLAINSLFRWGPVQLRAPSVSYSYTVSDGIQSQPGQETKTVIQTVSSVWSLGLGDRWSLTYVPSMSFYSDDDLDDSLNHSLNLNGATTYEDWSFGLSQGYALSSTPLVETGGQTEQESFSTTFSADYQLTRRASLSLSVSQNIRSADNAQQTAPGTQDLSNSKEWSTTDWLNYQFLPKLNGGIGVGFGYAQNGSDTTYESLNARINWQVGNRLNLALGGGFETRQFLDTDQPDLFNPLFSASIGYQLFDQTSLSLSASRSVNTSYFENQVTENTSIGLGLSQRLLGRFNLSLSGGFSTTDYVGSTTGVTANRADESTFYSASLSTALFKRGSISVFYSVSENNTGTSQFDYSSTQMGVSLSYQF